MSAPIHSLRAASGRSGVVVGAAAVASTVYLGFGALQLALAAGAPLGEHVWGGRYDEVLPPSMRVVSVAAAGVLGAMAYTVAARAELVTWPLRRPRSLRAAAWAVAGYTALNTLGNAASSSAVEQFVSAPLTALATVGAVIVARS